MKMYQNPYFFVPDMPGMQFPETALQQVNTQQVFQMLRREHPDLFTQLERRGISSQLANQIFFLLSTFAIGQAGTNLSANQVYNRFRTQVPWITLLLRQYNIPQHTINNILQEAIQIILNLLRGDARPDGRWSGWESLGGTIASAPAAASWQPNRLDVFARGTDNALWHIWWNGRSWSGWESLGGNITSAPAAVSWGPNRIDVFARGTDDALWHIWWNGNNWSEWEGLGGPTTSAPPVPSRRSNQLDVFARGTDNALWKRTWNGNRWEDWQSLGGNIASEPAAVSWGPNRIDV